MYRSMSLRVLGAWFVVFVAFPTVTRADYEGARKALLEGHPEQLIERCESDADLGDPLCQAMLGQAYFFGDGYGVERDLERALHWDKKAFPQLRKLAGEGNVYAMEELAALYESGRGGVDTDLKESVSWMRKAAENGSGLAQHNLGVAYFTGEGVPGDKKEGIKWLRKAADQGIPRSQRILGNLYVQGDGIRKNKREGVKWWSKSAAQGDLEAQYNLGLCHATGRDLGCRKNLPEAIVWFRKAADEGFAPAQVRLGNGYYSGEGVAEDKREAVRWFRTAAEQGDAEGQLSLGVMYFSGEGVAKDGAEAVRWARLAADQGNATADRFLKEKLASTVSDLEDRKREEKTKGPDGRLTICKPSALNDGDMKEMILGYFNSPSPTGTEAKMSMARDAETHWNRYYFEVQEVEIKAREKSGGYTLGKAKVVLSLPKSDSHGWVIEKFMVTNAKAGGQVLALGVFVFSQSELDDCWTTLGVKWQEGKAIN